MVIQGIRDFEGQLVRAVKGLSQACVLYAKLLMHGVHVDLEKLQSKKTAAERQALVFDEATEEEQFMQVGYTHGLPTRFPRTYRLRHQIGQIH